MNLFLGIDPGKLGGWALIWADGTPEQWGKFADWHIIVNHLPEIRGCCLEKVGLWRNDSDTGGKIFGIGKLSENLGFWKEILKSWNIKYELIPSMTWKAYFGLTKRKGRVPLTIYEYAKRRWPAIIKYKNQDGIAVGLILAELARSKAIIQEA